MGRSLPTSRVPPNEPTERALIRVTLAGVAVTAIGLFASGYFTVKALQLQERTLQEQVEATRQQTEATKVQTKALEAQRVALEAQIWQMLAQQQVEISKAKLEHPDLLPYFEAGANPDKVRDPRIRARIALIAEMHLDFFDGFEDEFVSFLPGMEKPAGKYRILWEAWFHDTFANSPALCGRYKEAQAFYGAELARFSASCRK